jgi:hypothetical protein
MASGFQVNIVITAGVSFYQEFTLTEPDLSPKQITGSKFFANLSKHPRSIDVVASTSEKPKYNYHKFQTRVVNGTGGVFALSMSSQHTNKLKEGKYVFSVIMREKTGFRSMVLDGLAFVDVAFGDAEFEDGGSIGGGADVEFSHVLDGGSASDKY